MSSRFVYAVASFVFGGFGAIGLAPHGIWSATIASLAIAFLVFSRAETVKDAAFYGWLYGIGYFIVALFWIVEPFFVEPEVYGWMAPFALPLMAGGLALFWSAAFGLAFVSSYRSGYRSGASLVVTWGLAEFVRAYVFTGFPWAAPAQIWVGSGPDLLLSVIGPHGLGMITLLAGYSVYALVSSLEPWRLRVSTPLMAALIIGLGFIFEYNLPDVTFSEFTVRIVQPNAPQDEKWDPEKAPIFFARQLRATRAGPERPDLVVWPETSLLRVLNRADEALGQIVGAAQGSQILLGVNRRDRDAYYNSLIVVDPSGQIIATYDKHHLVPFGEYLPFSRWLRSSGIRALAEWSDGGYAPGPHPHLISLGEIGKALPLICYEAIFPQHARVRGERPDMLVQITNDAWFGTYSGPYQHLAQARMRAIEQGLPMIRSANTGVSAMIDPYGRIVGNIEMGQDGFIDSALPVPIKPTIYSHTGDWPVLLLLLALSIGTVMRKQRNSLL